MNMTKCSDLVLHNLTQRKLKTTKLFRSHKKTGIWVKKKPCTLPIKKQYKKQYKKMAAFSENFKILYKLSYSGNFGVLLVQSEWG